MKSHYGNSLLLESYDLAEKNHSWIFCRTWGSILVCLCLIWFCLSSLAYAQEFVGKEQERALKVLFVGKWVTNIGKIKVELEIADDGSYILNGKEGKYSIKNNILKLSTKDTEVSYQFELAGDVLTLSGGDLSQVLKFVRHREVAGTLRSLFRFSPESVRLKLYRILVIVAVVLISRLIILLLRTLSHFVIFSDWGPLGFLYPHNKNRVLTIHSLVLNLFKYVIYFTAMGFILTELGVNYKAYLASLSVIGLAVGFGSQGLVQDMVTGFFLIFEGQFDVGDMVEISGQTGIVEELGLRMTKLRNYVGQRVVVPNRNIAIVGNFTKGALQAYVDVAVNSHKVVEQGSRILQQIGEEVSRQFGGVILTKPEILGAVSLDTDEHFIRLNVAIWPQQQWVIDQQLVPRIREVFKRQGLEISSDRVVVFYHIREKHSTSTWRQTLKNIKRRLKEK